MSARVEVAMLVVVAIGLAGCSDANVPSEANFRKALEPVMKDVFCSTLQVDRLVPQGGDQDAAFPLVVSAAVPAFGFEERKATRSMLDEAARRGLLTRTQGETVAGRGSSDAPPVRQPTITYAPTDRGAEFFRGVEGRTVDHEARTFPAVCGATGEVVAVVRWTDPADLFGQKVSRVTYTYRGVDPIPMATDAERAKVAATQERTVPMVLASDGWRKASR